VPSGFAEVELSLIYSSRVPNKAAAAASNIYGDGPRSAEALTVTNYSQNDGPLLEAEFASPLAPIASRQSEQVPKSNAKYLPSGLMCSMKFTIPKTPPPAVRMTSLSVLVNVIGSLASGA
jgi:hypothetical protein